MKKKLLLAIGLICLAFSLATAGCGLQKGPQQPSDGPTPEGAVYTVTVSFDDTLGTVTLTPSAEGNKYSAGTSVTAEAAPLPGRTLLSFKADGEEKTLTDDKYTFVIGKDTSLEATFGTNPMPASVFNSLKGKTAYTGTGEEDHIYDGYEEYPIAYSYKVEVAFDGDLVHHSLYENGMNLYLHNWIYKNENGKAVSYARQIDNSLERKDTGEDFSRFGNPFEAMTAEDFIDIGDDNYLLTDPEKASAAAFALTGMEEEIEKFVVCADGGVAVLISIDSVEDARGEGITIDYIYTSSFVFFVADPVDLDGRTEEYETKAEHASLAAALQKAAAAQSYKYHVVEDGSYEYNFYVTDKAIYNDEEGSELGYYLHSDDLVHEIYIEDGKLVLGDPVQGTLDGEHYVTTSDITSLQPVFVFAPELFEPKGNGVFAMRPEDPDLIHEVAQRIWSFGDDLTMNFAQTVEITVENDVLKKISVTCKVMMFDTTFELTYSGWNDTALPLPIEGIGGGTKPDTPVTPDTPDTPAPYPAKFIGKYTGEKWSGTKYAVEITATGITVSIDEVPATVADIGYDAATGKIPLKVNGIPCTISATGEASSTVSEITFVSDDFTINGTLGRVTEGGEGTVTIPEQFYGTFACDENHKHYEVKISASGVEATVDGAAITVTVTGYNIHKELEILFDGTPCSLSVELDSEQKPLSIGIMSANDFSVNLTLYPVAGEGPASPDDDEGGSDAPVAGKEKFYGTYEGKDVPLDSDEGTTYLVTISTGGITVSIDGVAATVTEVSYNEGMEEFTFKVNGEDYSISANSDDAPLSEIALWFEGFHSAILARKA